MIEVILDKSLVEDFGDIHSSEGRVIDKILLNENNVFIVNQTFLDYFEQNIKDVFKQKWEDYFVYLSDNKKLESSINNTLDTSIIFNEYTKKFDFRIIVKNLIESKSDNNTCFLKDNSINNIPLKNLIETNSVTLRSNDFGNDIEIKEFFKKLFNCVQTNHRIRIISRHNNFNCDLINVLKNKFTKKNYRTTSKRTGDPSINVQLLRRQLGNSLFLYTGTKEQIHERKFIIGCLIVEFDDDFNKIVSDVSTWSCNCIVNESLALTLLAKENELRRIY